MQKDNLKNETHTDANNVLVAGAFKELAEWVLIYKFCVSNINHRF